jgi:hypothetical protein
MTIDQKNSEAGSTCLAISDFDKGAEHTLGFYFP